MRIATAASAAVILTLAAASPGLGQDYRVPDGTPDNIARAVASTERSQDMTARDALRRPAEILMLAGVDEGDTVIEFAGFGQYYTTMLSDAVGPDGRVAVFDLPYTEERAGEASRAFESAHPNTTYTLVEYDEMSLPQGADAAFIVLYYHDLHVSRNDVDIAAFNAKVFEALKPGGTYLVIDHNAEDGSGTSRTDELHRIDPQVIRDEVTAAGFELAEDSDLLAHPEDPRTAGIRGMPGRDLTDRAVLVFRKPG